MVDNLVSIFLIELCHIIIQWYSRATSANSFELVAHANIDRNKSIQSGGQLILLQAQNSFGEFM